MLGYTDSNEREVLFSNFPYNCLDPNQFLSKTQTYRKLDQEFDFSPLDKVYDDKFTYYTPYGNYFGRERLSNYFQIETEEIGTSSGFFEKTHEHPEQKLLTNFSYWVSTAIGFIEKTLVIIGKTSHNSMVNSGEAIGQTNHKDGYTTLQDSYDLKTVDDLLSFDVIGYTSALIASSISATGVFSNAGKFTRILSVIKAALVIISSIAVKIPYSILMGAKLATETLNNIKNLSGYQQYAYQFNSRAIS